MKRRHVSWLLILGNCLFAYAGQAKWKWLNVTLQKRQRQTKTPHCRECSYSSKLICMWTISQQNENWMKNVAFEWQSSDFCSHVAIASVRMNVFMYLSLFYFLFYFFFITAHVSTVTQSATGFPLQRLIRWNLKTTVLPSLIFSEQAVRRKCAQYIFVKMVSFSFLPGRVPTPGWAPAGLLWL